MKDRFHFFLGSLEWMLFPSFALLLGIAGFTATRGVSTAVSVSILAAVFPLGYWVIGLYPVSGMKGARESAEAYFDIGRGAQIASYAILAAFIPFAIILNVVYGQFLTGFGFMLVSLGSFWIPAAYSAAPRAKLLALDSNAKAFKSLGNMSYNTEKVAAVFLVLFLGKRMLLQRLFPTLIFLFFLVAVYAKGWIILGTVGAYPAILVGLTAPVLVVARSFLSIRRIPFPQRTSVSDRLSTEIPSRTIIGGRLGVVVLSVLAVLFIAYILRI